jgi:hypothetical protein
VRSGRTGDEAAAAARPAKGGKHETEALWAAPHASIAARAVQAADTHTSAHATTPHARQAAAAWQEGAQKVHTC